MTLEKNGDGNWEEEYKITIDKKPWQIGRNLFAGIAVAALFFKSDFLFFAEENQDSYEKVIAHGGGDYKGYETSNSVDAVKNSIKNGYKMIELDMDISSDNHIVMIHDWDRTTKNYFGTTFEKNHSEKFLNWPFMKSLKYWPLKNWRRYWKKKQGN